MCLGNFMEYVLYTVTVILGIVSSLNTSVFQFCIYDELACGWSIQSSKWKLVQQNILQIWKEVYCRRLIFPVFVLYLHWMFAVFSNEYSLVNLLHCQMYCWTQKSLVKMYCNFWHVMGKGRKIQDLAESWTNDLPIQVRSCNYYWETHGELGHIN